MLFLYKAFYYRAYFNMATLYHIQADLTPKVQIFQQKRQSGWSS